MQILPAMKATLQIAVYEKMPQDGPLSYAHLTDMYDRATGQHMSYGKLCRWIGWMQCAVVASGSAALEQMKQINASFKGDGPLWRHRERGSDYEVVDHDASLQCSSAPEIERHFEGKTFTVYRSQETGKIFLRPTDEFMDGRFEKIGE